MTKFSKPEFLGRGDLVRQKEAGSKRKLVGFGVLEPGIARSELRYCKTGRSVGGVTSGTKSPSLGKAIALAYVSTEDAEIGNMLMSKSAAEVFRPK